MDDVKKLKFLTPPRLEFQLLGRPAFTIPTPKILDDKMASYAAVHSETQSLED
jgi:hypothetical protein